MKTLDLSHPISATMPVYPGTQPPEIVTACTLEKDSFVEKKISLYSHTGTHMDAPSHLFATGQTLDKYHPDWFWGQALVIDCSQLREIEVKDLTVAKEFLRQVSFVLIYTGWSRYWGQDQYFKDFPVLTQEAAAWLAEFNLKGIGVDAISVDEVGNTEFTVHKAFLSNQIVIIENLTNLTPLVGKNFEFFCFPLKIAEADGSPIRAVAIF